MRTGPSLSSSSGVGVGLCASIEAANITAKITEAHARVILTRALGHKERNTGIINLWVISILWNKYKFRKIIL
jgi:hypothetical protein